MSASSRKPGWQSLGFNWAREALLKPAYRVLSKIEHPRQVRQGLDLLETAYHRVTAREARVEGSDPFVLVVAWGATPESLGRLADEVQLAKTAFPGWEPVVVTDCDGLEALAQHDCKVEYIPPHREWCSVNDPQDWPGFIAGRLARLRTTYTPAGVILVAGPDDLGFLGQGLVQIFGPA